MAKRKNPDTVATSYRYDIHRIVGDVPPALWLTAKAMNQLWNKLVEAHDAMLARLPEAAQPEDWRQAYVRFLDGVSKAAAERQGIDPVPPLTTEAYLIARDEGTRLGLEFSQKWAVYERFKAAVQRFRQKKGGKPTFHKGLRSLNIPFRCETGGVSLAWVERRENRIYVRPVDRGVYQAKHSEAKHYFGTRGHFDVRNPESGEAERVTFEMPLHRPMPSDTVIKSMSLVGEHLGALGWQWGFVFTVNHLPVTRTAPATWRGVGLDLGWRVRGDALRIATLWDGARATEILLPLDLSSNEDRRLQKRIRQTGGLPEHTRHLRDIWGLQARLDAAKDRTKADLLALERSDWPEDARQMMSGITKMGRSGLRRLRRTLYDATIALECLDEWYTEDARLAKRIRKAQLDWERAKLAIYDQLGDWLARHFDAVAIEDVSLKKIAEKEYTAYDGALYHSRKFRQAAGLYKLRLIIKRNFAKYGKAEQVFEINATDTTRRHHSGTGTATPSAELLLKYSGGQLEDQDVNAATNLWQSLPDEMRAVTANPASVDRSQLLRVLKPISAVAATAK